MTRRLFALLFLFCICGLLRPQRKGPTGGWVEPTPKSGLFGDPGSDEEAHCQSKRPTYRIRSHCLRGDPRSSCAVAPSPTVGVQGFYPGARGSLGCGARRTWCEDRKSTSFFQRRPHIQIAAAAGRPRGGGLGQSPIPISFEVIKKEEKTLPPHSPSGRSGR